MKGFIATTILAGCLVAAGAEAEVQASERPLWPPLGETRSPPPPPVHTIAHWRPEGALARTRQPCRGDSPKAPQPWWTEPMRMA